MLGVEGPRGGILTCLRPGENSTRVFTLMSVFGVVDHTFDPFRARNMARPRMGCEGLGRDRSGEARRGPRRPTQRDAGKCRVAEATELHHPRMAHHRKSRTADEYGAALAVEAAAKAASWPKLVKGDLQKWRHSKELSQGRYIVKDAQGRVGLGDLVGIKTTKKLNFELLVFRRLYKWPGRHSKYVAVPFKNAIRPKSEVAA